MQIHELTKKKKVELDEGWADAIGSTDIGQMAGAGVNAIKGVGSAIASPFKDVAQGYKSARQDQKVSAMADKAFRAWQNYVAQLEQSIAKQPAPVPAATTSSTGGQTQKTNTGLTHTANANNPNKTAAGAKTPPPTNGATTPAADATTPPAKTNYGAQTGAGANVTYKQPAGVPNPMANTIQPTSRNMVQPATTPPATVASTAQGQPITVGGQKLKPGQPGYDQLAKATLKELQAPAAAVSPALAAFRDRTDGKYESYLTAFVQKNLLAGLGFKGLVNQQEITNAIKAIASPENADATKQRPLWNDLARACALAVPAVGALTGRDPKAPKDPNAPSTTAPGEEPAPDTTSDATAGAETAKPTMTKDQISQWISRNSEDNATLKAALAAINSAGKA
jgi:hypothetical protein